MGGGLAWSPRGSSPVVHDRDTEAAEHLAVLMAARRAYDEALLDLTTNLRHAGGVSAPSRRVHVDAAQVGGWACLCRTTAAGLGWIEEERRDAGCDRTIRARIGNVRKLTRKRRAIEEAADQDQRRGGLQGVNCRSHRGTVAGSVRPSKPAVALPVVEDHFRRPRAGYARSLPGPGSTTT